MEQKSGLIKKVDGEQVKEYTPKKGDRLLILGTNSNGAPELARKLGEFLLSKDRPNIEIEILRNAQFLYFAMYGVENFEDLKDPTKYNLPRGVILLPNMRQYAPNGSGMTVDSKSCGISEEIQRFCKEKSIPIVETDILNPDNVVFTFNQLNSKPQGQIR